MKRHNNLWQEFISNENLNLAARRAVQSKKNKPQARRFLGRRDELMQNLREKLIRGEFKTSPYRVFAVFEPKRRLIYELPLYPDHIVHHALINVLGPIWCRMFIRDSFACIPGRGLHGAAIRTMEFMRRNKYVLQCDIRKFYPSLNHDVMINILQRKISDRRIVELLSAIIRSGGDGKNIPIGNLTSQWLGNVYLNELDYFVKHKLRWADYIRYCDDFCLFGDSKDELHRAFTQITRFVETELQLVFSRYCIRPTRCGITFIGYRFFPGFVLMRRRGRVRLRRRIAKIAAHNDTSDLAVGQLAAAHGWLKWACTYNYRNHLMRVARQYGADKETLDFIRYYLFMEG